MTDRKKRWLPRVTERLLSITTADTRTASTISVATYGGFGMGRGSVDETFIQPYTWHRRLIDSHQLNAIDNSK